MPGIEMMKERLAGWPAVDRLVSRLAGLSAAWAALRGFSRDCLRGDPAADTLFLDYERDASGPPAGVFAEHGIRLRARFDRGDARLRFPSLSVAAFGDEQISRLSVEGPPTAEFRALEEGIWTVLYQEVKRFEREHGRPSRPGTIPLRNPHGRADKDFDRGPGAAEAILVDAPRPQPINSTITGIKGLRASFQR